MSPSSIDYKTTGGMQIAFIKKVITSRAEILPLLEQLKEICGERICGPALTIFHFGSVKEGILVETAYPVIGQVESCEVQTRILESRNAWTLLHRGSHNNLNETRQEILEFVQAHAGIVGGGLREIYINMDLDSPEKNITEIQLLDHGWDHRLALGVEEELGTEAKHMIMAGIESISEETPAADYRNWVHTAIRRIDEWTDDPQVKYSIVSCCAHVFPQHRIDQLRSIFVKSHNIDDVLREMYQDPDWYEQPLRKGNQLLVRKVPYDREVYEKATTKVEQRQAYCHCALVRPYLTESPAKISPTFCLCGAGWYRRLWEGILGQPIQVKHVETLVKGNDCCTLIINLPFHFEGEMSPQLADLIIKN